MYMFESILFEGEKDISTKKRRDIEIEEINSCFFIYLYITHLEWSISHESILFLFMECPLEKKEKINFQILVFYFLIVTTTKKSCLLVGFFKKLL